MDPNNRTGFRNAYQSLLIRVESADVTQQGEVDALWAEYEDLSEQLDQQPSLRNNARLLSLDARVLSALSFKRFLMIARIARE